MSSPARDDDKPQQPTNGAHSNEPKPSVIDEKLPHDAFRPPTADGEPSAQASVAQPSISIGTSPVRSEQSLGGSGGSGGLHSMSKDQILAYQQKLADRYRMKQTNGSSGTQGIEHQCSAVESSGDTDQSALEKEIGEYERWRAIIDRKENAGKLSVEEQAEFLKFEAQHKAKLRKYQIDQDHDRSPTPQTAGPVASNESTRSQAGIQKYIGTFSSPEAAAGKSRPNRKRKSATMETESSSDDGDQDDKKFRASQASAVDRKNRRRIDGQNHMADDLDHALQNGRNKSNPIAKGGKGSRAASGRVNGSHNLTNVSSIRQANVFDDANEVANLPSQPRFDRTGRRKDALQQLTSSLPEEDRRVGLADRRALDNACRDFNGKGSVTAADDGNWFVKGMKTTLKSYQVLGVAFMRRRENNASGGIMADEMGLGKTISMLANIVNGKPPRADKCRTTLIIAAPALITQWRAEIATHVKTLQEDHRHGLGDIVEYHARSRLRSNNLQGLLESADIVLTTYGEICNSYPKAILPPHLTTAAQKDEWWRNHFENHKGIFHRIKFLRIVIDEAQAIKNHKGHTSLAVRAVQAKFHWAVTGTPVMNGVSEFYPYFKFIREPDTGTFDEFKDKFCTAADPKGVQKLSVMLRSLMIRRTHIDKLFNARLLDLPTPKEHTLWLDFNDVERVIYEIVRSRMIRNINNMSKTEGAEKSYSHIWTMILRLRQLCGHIFLIQETIFDILEREDFEKLNRLTENENRRSEESRNTLLHLRHVLTNFACVKNVSTSTKHAVQTASEMFPSGRLPLGEPNPDNLGGKHGQAYRFKKYMASLIKSKAWYNLEEETKCTSCGGRPHKPAITSCFHIYCKSCVNDLQLEAARAGRHAADCTKCGDIFDSVESIPDLDTFLNRKGTSLPSQDGVAHSKGKGKDKKKESQGKQVEHWLNMEGEVLPSTKTMACKTQIQTWLEEARKSKINCKIIVYTQFLPVVRILSKVCQSERWDYVTYTGDMSQDARERAIRDFGDETKDVKVMVASLKCGGLGLNLTMASRVICFDPWWNESVEQQAFCRVFRIGQTQETRLTRFVIKNSIDAAMMATKQNKQHEINAVMSASGKAKDVKDLMKLFGSVGEDKNGKPIIFAEPDDNDENEDDFMSDGS